MKRLHRFCLGCVSIHLFYLLVASLGELTWIIANGYTALPPVAEDYGQMLERLTGTALGHSLPASNPLRQFLNVYLQCSGIDTGYAFFAPNVPNSYKVVFEIRYPDGKVEYDLPHITQSANAVRLSTLLDAIGRTEYGPLREAMVKMLTFPVQQAHPDAITIRTIFGYIEEPTIAEARAGKKESYKVLHVYDFSLPLPEAGARHP